jgi:hypothetical protein
MPGHGPKSYPCVLCNKRTKPGERRPVNKDSRKILRKCFMVESKDGDVVCRKCRRKCEKLKQVPTHAEKPRTPSCASPIQTLTVRTESMKSPPSVTLPLPCTVNSHAYCVICRRPGPKLVVIPAQTRFKCFLEQNILIPAGTISTYQPYI